MLRPYRPRDRDVQGSAKVGTLADPIRNIYFSNTRMATKWTCPCISPGPAEPLCCTRWAQADAAPAWDGGMGAVKERTKKAVADIAKDLLELYATREIVSGYAFSDDTQWQHELEASFPYVETPDQLTVIDQVKRDMMQKRPMDRLVVGDVGYRQDRGDTAGGIQSRDGRKQVAILVPTTVLAQQHFATFKERLAPFPVSVEMLSRFRSDKRGG